MRPVSVGKNKGKHRRKVLIVAFSVMVMLIAAYAIQDKKDPEYDPVILNGYSKADFSKMNSPAEKNGMGGTKVYIIGELLEVKEIDNGIDMSYCGKYKDVDSHEWLVLLHSETFTPKETFTKAIGKTSIILGTYDGFSEMLKKPAVTLDRMYLIDSKEFINGMGLILEKGSNLDSTESTASTNNISATKPTEASTNMLSVQTTNTITPTGANPTIASNQIEQTTPTPSTPIPLTQNTEAPALSNPTVPEPQQPDQIVNQPIIEEPAPSKSPLAFQALPGAYRRNETAYFSIVGIPGETYYISVTSPKGNELTADGLGTVVADENGIAAWSWKVGGKTSFGTGTIRISGGGETVSAPYTITE